MNLLSNGYIWLLPWRTASRETYNIILNNNLTVTPFVEDKPKGYSHYIAIQKNYENCPVIINTRNPYSRIVFSWKLNQIINLNAPTNHTSMLLILCTPIEYSSLNIKLNTPSYLPFEEWLKTAIWWDRSVPDINYAHIVRFESFNEDIIKIPFIKNIPPTLKHKNDEGFMLSYITMHMILSANNGTFNKNYYIDFLDKNNLPDSPVNRNAKMWSKLRYYLPEYSDKHVEAIKQIFPITNADNVTLAELNEFFNPSWKRMYNEKTAALVYNNMKTWFTKFGYDEDSWK